MAPNNGAGHWYEYLCRLRTRGHTLGCQCASCIACRAALGENGMALFESAYGRVGGIPQPFSQEIARPRQARAPADPPTATRAPHDDPEPETAPVADDRGARFDDRWRRMPDPQTERLKQERDRLRTRLAEIQEWRAGWLTREVPQPPPSKPP